MIDTGLEGRVVLVTGANHGIGAASARAFATEGAAVFVSFLGLPPPDDVLAGIRARSGRVEDWEADLADAANIPALFDRAETTFGPIDVLVNNAAHWEVDSLVPREGRHPTTVRMVSGETHDRHFAVNSRAVVLMMAEYLRRYLARGARWGRIINISTDGAPGFRGEISYGASKAALESYSRAAASELGRYGITVNIVAPGPTQTGYITPDLEERLLPAMPLGRIGQPEDVADVIVFLASEQGRWLTGQTLFAGGGHRMV